MTSALVRTACARSGVIRERDIAAQAIKHSAAAAASGPRATKKIGGFALLRNRHVGYPAENDVCLRALFALNLDLLSGLMVEINFLVSLLLDQFIPARDLLDLFGGDHCFGSS
jgi:hypothetical protein